jgi:hypothetical protein
MIGRHAAWTAILGIAAILLAACGTATPSAPDPANSIVSTGAQVFRMALQTPCDARNGFLPMVYTRVTLEASGNEWIASARDATTGNLELRFHRSSARAIVNSMEVAGTLKGMATHMPELLQAPAWSARADFGVDGRTTVTGVAFAAGSFGSQVSGIDGVGSGPLVLSDGEDRTCTGTSFSWSLFPAQRGP